MTTTATPLAYGPNRLAAGVVTVTSAAAIVLGTVTDPDRLSDGFLGPRWEDAATTGLRAITLDQGVSPGAIGAVGIAAGHGCAGQLLTFATSDDGASWTTVATVTPADDSLVLLTFEDVTHRYARLSATDPASVLAFGELVFAPEVSLPYLLYGGLSRGDVMTVETFLSENGTAWLYGHDDARWRLTASLKTRAAVPLSTLRSFFAAIAASPFILTDETGTARFVRWVNPEILGQAELVDRDAIELEFEEVLG